MAGRKELEGHYAGQQPPPMTFNGGTLPELTIDGTPDIEVVDRNFMQRISTEAFMEEKVQIVIDRSSNVEDNPIPIPMVGDKSQPIVRGVPTWVKRKYVEALARSRPTTINQVINQTDYERFELVSQVGVSYPFRVIKDPNPNGAEWLSQILNDPN